MIGARSICCACIALLFAGLSNAHLHYCFDGQEQPVSLHLTDGIDPDHAHTGHGTGDHPDGHDDIDVDLNLADQALAKVSKFDQPALAAVASWSVMLAAQPAGVLIEWIALPPTPSSQNFRPQVRGPPV